ncbi:MAG: ABC transporter substrate-binding protein [Alphaproteobacteria bacterium]|nr:ABC transporter substrate-binding protein [Alphaproteobacteria bacterium]
MPTRRGVQIVLAGLIWLWPLAAWPASVIEPGQASAFIEKLGNEAINALAPSDVDRKVREARFQNLLDKGFAIKAIAKFVLGRHWRKADESQREQYLAVFEQLIVKSYTLRFEKYAGETFRVKSERADGKRGRMVETEIAREGAPPLVVQWRIRKSKSDASLKIVDVMVEGVSMVITQRSEFNAVIQRNGAGVDGLIRELEQKVAAFQ